MAEVNFYLKDKKSKKPTLVYLFFSYDGNRLKYSTGLKIEPSKWNPKKHRAKASIIHAALINKNLDNTKATITAVYFKLRSDGIPTNDQLRNALNERLKGSNKSQTFFEFAEQFIRQSELTKSQATVKQRKATVNDLRKFESRLGYRIDFDTLNLDFYNRYQEYHLKDQRNGLNLFGSRIGILKTMLSDATARGINKNLAFQSKQFKRTVSETSAIYFNDHELKTLYDLDLASNRRLDKVRDLFLIGCYTGLRFGDYSNIKPENIEETDDGLVLNIRTSKTKDNIEIPLNDNATAILSKYHYQLPKAISNQKFNNYLKELCQLAELNEPIEVFRNIAGHEVKKTVPKYQEAKTHTARRSFCTNLYKRAVSPYYIMRISGHKTEKEFLKYIRISDNEATAKIREAMTASKLKAVK